MAVELGATVIEHIRYKGINANRSGKVSVFGRFYFQDLPWSAEAARFPHVSPISRQRL